MLLENVKQCLQKFHNGAYITISWKTDITNAKSKKQGIEVYKITSGAVRLGINYAHTNYAKGQVTDGTTKRPSWFTHMINYPKIVINNKDESKKYLQVFSTNAKTLKTKYYINGQEVTKQQAQESGYALNSAFNKSNDIITYTLSLENIISLGK